MVKEAVAKGPELVERFVSEFDTRKGSPLNGSNATIAGIRQEAIEEFQRQGLPGRKNEAWKYTNIEGALKHPYSLADESDQPAVSREDIERLLIPGLDAYVVAVVNGRFRKELSAVEGLPVGTIIESFRTAGGKYADAFDHHFAKYADSSVDPMVALNTAFARDGLFINVPSGIILDKPIHVVAVTAADMDLLFQPRHLYVFGTSSGVRIVETYHSLSDARTFQNTLAEVFVGENASIELYKIQTENESSSQVNSAHVYQEQNSNFTVFTATFNGKLIRNNVTIVPDGENCESHLFGLYLLRDSQHVDNHTLVDHARPNCFSNELYKGVLDGSSTGIFNGKVFVRRDSQKTNAFQENKSVILTDDANMYAKPELEIYADDVKCSHGATTGRVDPEAMFYLRSRGIRERQARAMLLYAFALEVVENVAIEPLRRTLDQLIADRIS